MIHRNFRRPAAALLACVPLCLTATSSYAETPAPSRSWKPYLTVQVEGNALLPTDLTGTAEVGSGDINFGPGLGAGGALGLRLDSGLRLETEIMYRTTFIDDARLGDGQAFDGGAYSSLSFGLNVLGEFPVHAVEGLAAFAGAGAVYVQEADIDLERENASTTFQTSTFGAQLIAGGRYEVNDYFYVESSLRWLVTADATLKDPEADQDRLAVPYSPLSLTLGVGVTF